MRFPTILGRFVVGAVTATACTLSLASPASAQPPGGCVPDVYFELDAHGFVTAYPAARCGTNGPYRSIIISATLEVDGRAFVDSSESRYSNRGGGVVPGKGVRARNEEGNNRFCAITTVSWRYRHALQAESRTGRICATY
ncbi:hypothetical protein [Pseudonocardia sp.]|uniref:hypothetical protein n=1 Tax=Pseudonocardia sp. TaxID=60912 RepID=UPI00261F87E7|nr:hypothetical protein [Pseudonocardia sp.]